MLKRRRKYNKKTKIILCIAPIVMLFALAFLAQKIYAYTGKNEITANGIKYYDPEECAKDGGGTSTHLAGNTVDEKIWNYLISLGFNDAQAAGLMGNFEAESGNNPVRQADGNCWGIAMICTWSGQYDQSRQAFIDAGYGDYLGINNEYSKGGGEENIPAEDLDGLIKLAIDWIIKYCDENHYIYDGSYTEWIKTAQSPEEAAEIFTVVYERCVCHVSDWGSRCVRPEHLGSQWDTRYDGYQDLDRRRNAAREFYDLYSGNGTTADSTSSSLGSSTGANVTMIGDSITNMSTSVIKGKLPDIDIRSQGSKHMFMEAGEANGGPSGKSILADIVSKGELRDVLVIALGTNDPAALTESQIQSDIVDVAKDAGASKVIFINNAEVVQPDKYAQNNAVFTAVASANPDVDVADWAAIIKENPGLLNSGDVHPNAEGIERFATLIYESVGSLVGSQSSKSSGCNCTTKKSTGSYEGGLSDEQAQLLADDYNNGPISRWSTPGNETYDVLNNCVSFSKYIIRVMTDLTWGGGSGRDIVNTLTSNNPGLETGNEPKPFSIFSTENHTGFIVAVNGDDVLAVESAWPYPGNPSGYNGKLRHYTKSGLSSGAYKFAYIEDHLNSEFASAIGSTAVSTTSASSAAIVSASWQDGWITQGIEGYEKQDYKNYGVTPVDNSMDTNYITTSPKSGTMGPNKIVLHSVEGYNESSGIAVYNPSSAALSHFTVDLKNKKTYQHLPINKPSSGVKTHDDSAGVQIEIMGFSTSSSAGYTDAWFLENDSAFGDTEWAYLAKLLVAISDETGIPLTSDLDWSAPNRMDASAFKEYQGVVGHRHVPDNDHTDPGNIWGKVSEQLSKIQSGKTDGTCNALSKGSWVGNFPFLFQCQDEWSGSTWSGGTFCNAGCGVTSMAMVVSALTGDFTTPPQLTSVVDCDTTASSDCLRTYAEKFGIEAVHLSSDEGLGAGSSTQQIKQAFDKYLSNGYIIITAGHSNGSFSNADRNPFSSSGHYVVLYAIDENGDWLIADPGGRNRDWAAECTDIQSCKAHDNAMDPENLIQVGVQRKDGTGVSAWAFKK